MRSRTTYFITGLGAGALGMFLFDPDRGRRRRAVLRDQLRHGLHEAEELADKGGRDARNRAQGLVARAEGALSGAHPGPQHRQRPLTRTPTFRLLEGVAGMGLGLSGLVRGGLLGLPLGLAGLALLARAGIDTRPGERGPMIRVQKTITVDVAADQVFALWWHVENFPKFMEHVLSVTRTGDRRSHWTVTGPAHVPIEWDAEITELDPGRRIRWRSVERSVVDHVGEVQLEPTPSGGTRIHVRMEYRPPGGVLGHAAASFLGGDPATLLDDDLLRLKSLLESGKATAKGVETFRPEVS